MMPISTSKDTTLTSLSGWSGFAQGLSEGLMGFLLCGMPATRATICFDRDGRRQRARQHGFADWISQRAGQGHASVGTGSTALA